MPGQTEKAAARSIRPHSEEEVRMCQTERTAARSIRPHSEEEVRMVRHRIQDLHAQYDHIFKSRNRNAASHLWTSFLMRHAAGMPADRFQKLSAGYCAVSGSPVTPMPQTRYLSQLSAVGGGRVRGFMSHCWAMLLRCEKVGQSRYNDRSNSRWKKTIHSGRHMKSL